MVSRKSLVIQLESWAGSLAGSRGVQTVQKLPGLKDFSYMYTSDTVFLHLVKHCFVPFLSLQSMVPRAHGVETILLEIRWLKVLEY